MNFLGFFIVVSFFIIQSWFAIAWDGTFSTGQVVSSDGEVYDFASPKEQEKLREKFEAGGDQVGVLNNNLFIMQDDGIISVPMGEISGTEKKNLMK